MQAGCILLGVKIKGLCAFFSSPMREKNFVCVTHRLRRYDWVFAKFLRFVLDVRSWFELSDSFFIFIKVAVCTTHGCTLSDARQARTNAAGKTCVFSLLVCFCCFFFCKSAKCLMMGFLNWFICYYLNQHRQVLLLRDSLQDQLLLLSNGVSWNFLCLYKSLK